MPILGRFSVEMLKSEWQNIGYVEPLNVVGKVSIGYVEPRIIVGKVSTGCGRLLFIVGNLSMGCGRLPDIVENVSTGCGRHSTLRVLPPPPSVERCGGEFVSV